MALKLDKLAQRILDQNKIDNALLIKNDRVGRTARPRVNTVKKNLTGIDEELLKEYQQIKPNSFEYVDANGETKYRKYLLPDANPPELEENLPEAPQSELNRRLEQLDNDKRELMREYERSDFEVKDLQRYKKDLLDKINHSSADFLTPTLGETTMRRRVQKELEQLDAEIRNATSIHQQIIDDINNIDRAVEAERQGFFDYNTEAKRRKEYNLNRVNAYRDELNFLNKGAFSTEKADNESEMEYLERLQRNAEIQSPEDELTDAKALTITKFREKMREIIKDPVLIEQVINTLDNNSDENVDSKATLLKNWSLLKSKFISTYGVNNKRITASDIITFFDFFLESGESGLSKAIEGVINAKNEPIGINTSGIDITPIPNEDTIFIQSHSAGGDKNLFLRSITDGSKLHLIYSFTGDKGSFKEFFDEDIPANRKGFRTASKSSIEIFNHTTITPEQFNKLFDITIKKVNPSLVCKKMMDKYGIRSIPFTSQDVEQKQYAFTKGAKPTQVEYGMGIPAENVPQYINFGNVILLLQKLYYHNQLSVKNKQLKSVAGFRTTRVSEAFVKLIMNMIKGLQPSHSDVSSLSASERQLYDRLVQVANLNKSVAHQGDKTISDLKHRLKLIEGEISIGNNNPMLKKELYSVLHSLKNFKVITQSQITNYMKQFS
jgi:hypothetical protein